MKPGTGEEPGASALRAASRLRAQIEAFAAGEAAARAAEDPVGRAVVESAMAGMRAALRRKNYPAFREADRTLHLAIIALANIPFLADAWEPVWTGLIGFHQSSFDRCWPDLRVLVRAHEHLVEAVLLGDAGAAGAAAHAHMEAVWYRMHGGRAEDPLDRALAHMDFRIADPALRLEPVARQVAFVSPGHLSRLFRERLGRSFKQYLQMARLRKAAELLAGTRLPVRLIANRVGYRDVSRLGLHFKRAYGVPPAGYRRGLR